MDTFAFEEMSGDRKVLIVYYNQGELFFSFLQTIASQVNKIGEYSLWAQ